jgi:hypothetical protein
VRENAPVAKHLHVEFHEPITPASPIHHGEDFFNKDSLKKSYSFIQEFYENFEGEGNSMQIGVLAGVYVDYLEWTCKRRIGGQIRLRQILTVDKALKGFAGLAEFGG